MLVTPSGIVTLVKLTQLLKTSILRIFTPFGIVTVFKPIQLTNA